jgi:hypothetical protein
VWWPFALPQRRPFCWWVAVAIDHFSRRALGVTAFKTQPTSTAVRAFLGRAATSAIPAGKCGCVLRPASRRDGSHYCVSGK